MKNKAAAGKIARGGFQGYIVKGRVKVRGFAPDI